MLWRDVRGEIIRDNEHPFEGFMRIADGEGDLLGEMLCGGSVRSLELDSPTEIEAAAGAHGAPADSLRSAFRGVLSFYRASETELLPVNIAHIEDYLRGVVPAEIGAFAPTEALKAQAIASRSEAIYKLLAGSRHGDPRYDFVSTQQDQVYRGAGEEAPASDREVAATRGLVMTSGGAVIDAVYSHSCGGATASNEDLWPRGQPLPYLRSRIDRSCGGAPELGDFASVDDWLDSSPEVFCNPAQSEFPLYAKGYFRWSRVRKGDEIEAEARERGLAIGPLRYLRVKERAPSGRVVRLELQGEKAVIEIANGDTIQGLLGLPSTLFTMGVSVKDGRVEAAAFRGAGYGHGVGMCQMGAFMMARRKFNCDDILGHYFAGVRIESLY
ncbi:MAG: Amidase enhancer precursor [candidate division BRC1 bacterium ADurb.BinA364]|nr:MAG: Amidase enhancer precursor [candidate division BRC1 bacterium ADurb.BinA364]